VMFKSMVLTSPSCWSEAIWWLMHKPSAVMKGLNPLDPPMSRPRSVVRVKGVLKAMTCGETCGDSIGRYYGPSTAAAMDATVGFLRSRH
jgi:hypothetical protein